jgi:hypothetical protein
MPAWACCWNSNSAHRQLRCKWDQPQDSFLKQPLAWLHRPRKRWLTNRWSELCSIARRRQSLSKRRPGHWYSQRPTCCHRPTSQLRPTSGSWAHWLTATLALKRLPRKRTDWPRLWPQEAFGRFSYKLCHLKCQTCQLTDVGPLGNTELGEYPPGSPFGEAPGSVTFGFSRHGVRSIHRYKHCGHSKYFPLRLACIMGTTLPAGP